MRILTFNWHEPYICLFARTGHTFDVAPPCAYQEKTWKTSFRPVPDNVTLIDWPIDYTSYDLVLCLALPDVRIVYDWDVPRRFVMLNMISTDTGLTGVHKDFYVQRISSWWERVDLTFISEKKRQDWGADAPVVVSGIDPADYGGYTGQWPWVLTVGNRLLERDHMQGYRLQEEMLKGIPWQIIGDNPKLFESRPSTSWDDLKAQYRHHRLLLSTLSDQHEDGYNLAVLEAMATGMPVVSLANSSSPIIDGVNGYVSEDPAYLRDRVRVLLGDQGLAARLGEEARQTVYRHFNIRDCVDGWNRLFDETRKKCTT